MKLFAKNWGEFQHYKNRCPPWIRLHRKLLDDRAYQRLPVESRALAPMLWLLASESMDGEIDGDIQELAFRLRQSEKEIEKALKPLLESGFFVTEQVASAENKSAEHVASTAIASRQQDATPEERQRRVDTDTDSEKETEGETEKAPSAVVSPYSLGFELFWSAWPMSQRKVAKGKCYELWKKSKLDGRAGEIAEKVKAWATTAQWRDGFDPKPETWLNQGRFDDEVVTDQDVKAAKSEQIAQKWSGASFFRDEIPMVEVVNG